MGEILLSQLGVYAARPTLRVDGQQNDRIDTLLQAMVLAEQEGGLSSLRVTFANWESREDGGAGPAFEDESVLKLGSELTVYGGEIAAPTEVFRGKVGALELRFDSDGPPKLTAYAEDGLAKSRLTRRIEIYENKSVADVARAIAQRAALTPQITGLTDATDTWFQCNESDLAFLRRLLRRFGADVQVVASELHVAPRDQVHRNDIELRLHSQLYRVRAVADLAQQASEVRVTGFDPIQGQAIAGTGSGAQLGPGSGRTGKAELERAFSEREEQMSHQLALTQVEARALAQANFAARARGFVRVEGVCEGNPNIRVGSHLSLKDVSPRFDNTYYVTACVHRFDVTKGFETEFTAEGAYFGNAA
jgi:Bacteriophage probable baseplate hub protein